MINFDILEHIVDLVDCVDTAPCYYYMLGRKCTFPDKVSQGQST